MKIADLFCGAGGETTGIMQALGIIGGRHDMAAVNHWDIAMQTHRHNHPQSRSYCEDLQALNPLDVFTARDRLDLLWASPECTHHSNARGGRPCSNQSRASAWLILKWLSELYVRRVILENVPEFLNWGPLGSDGRPLESRKGETFRAFVAGLKSLGYSVDWRLLCAADYGDPTTRTRLFVQAVRGRGRIRWPEPTHAQQPGLFGERSWVLARSIIDWSIPGESIRNRKRPLAPATLDRIEAGIRRYWGEWADPFLVILRGTSNTREISRPLPAITAGGQHVGLVEPFLYQITHGGRGFPLTRPLATITTAHRGEIGVVEPFLLHQITWGRPRSVNEPVPTIMTKCSHGLVEPFLVKYNGTALCKSLRVPIGAITTKDRYALVQGLAQLDITFRMLQPHELAAAQGFPREYWFAGTKTEQVRQIGNSVPVGTARALALEALSA